ncbi:MAG: M23 family metallopeptidase, partial [Spirochaetales bacterium]|nr:M23 family metallopeptidase [Spirochaetales bacterium]
GTDISIISFEYQDIGVPVVAVEEGIVKKIYDGQPDKELTLNGLQGNYVLIDHGNGVESYYNHLKKNSIIVKEKQKVYPGEQIAELGSSGNSTWPHLHFEWRINGKSIDPFTGPDHPGKSYWREQPLYDFPMIIVDWGMTYESEVTKPPHTIPREKCALMEISKQKKLQLWIQVINVQNEKYIRKWEIVSPDGAYKKEFVQEIDGTKKWHGLGSSQWRYTYNLGFSKSSMSGVWKLIIYHDSQIGKELHFTVSNNEIKNRRPQKPAGIRFEPENPKTDDVVTCRVSRSLFNLDPDLDKERYRFEWILNDEVVRNKINATMCDYFPAYAANHGDTLICRVYASDGELESEAVTINTQYH